MKELIYYHSNLLSPKGGPAGYLFNLKMGLDKLNIEEIDFLPECKESAKDKIRRTVAKLPELYKIVHFFTQKQYGNSILNKIFNGKRYQSVVDLNDYDIVHFHNTLDMFLCKDSLREFSGKVILTSHSPKVFHKELLDDFAESTKKRRKKQIAEIDIIDKYSFERADYVIFPVPEAMECYVHSWNEFENIYKSNKEKFLFLPTGTAPRQYKISRREFREKYGIPQNAYVLAYVGRHNEVKGYDTVKKIAQQLLKKYDDIYFVIGGQQGPLYQMNNNRWIEVGWTDDPGSIINAADVFLLPNKETYFDLVMLEVLSIGTPVIASYTGGNKYFEKFNDKGISLYKTYDELLDMIELFKSGSFDLDLLRKQNKSIFSENFSNDRFAEKYVRMMEDIYAK